MEMEKLTRLQDMYHHMVKNYKEMDEMESPTSTQENGNV